MIDGMQVPGVESVEDINPSQPNDVIAAVELGDSRTADGAVAAAEKAAHSWRTTLLRHAETFVTEQRIFSMTVRMTLVTISHAKRAKRSWKQSAKPGEPWRSLSPANASAAPGSDWTCLKEAGTSLRSPHAAPPASRFPSYAAEISPASVIRTGRFESELAAAYGAFMEPSGRNWWQPVANATASRTAQTGGPATGGNPRQRFRSAW
jgi:hypothetical protein